jgi:uncharacterized protein YjiS (DUF1127 family)
MTAITTTAAPTAVAGFSPKRMLARILAAMLAADAHARTRHDYQRMMESEHILRDVGICRENVRQALENDRF